MSHNEERIKIQRETICKGCDANAPSNSCTYLPIIHKDTIIEAICPCSVCLVKGVCINEEGCEMTMKYFKVMVPVRDRVTPPPIEVKLKTWT
jgi:hypothetical protein